MALTNEDLQAISQLLDTKIGGALQPIKDEIREVKEDLRAVKEELEGVKTEVQSLRVRMEHVVEDVRGIKLHLENVTDRNIQILAENYVPAAKRYERGAEEIEAIKSEQEIMKKVITKHSEILQTLAAAT